MVRILRRVYNRLYRVLDRRLLKLASSRMTFASFYYGVFRSEFRREFISFAAGRVRYAESLAETDGSMAVLRRNTHRLEKGLLMKPRRLPFASKYIAETVDAFVTATRQNVDELELAWAEDVLTEYFRLHSSFKVLEKQRQKFAASKKSINQPRKIPYARDTTLNASISIDQLSLLAHRRRSVRWFSRTSVPRALIDKAIEIARQSPSACNRQPFQFRIFDTPELVQKLAEIPIGMIGYAENVPVLVAVIGQQRNYYSERDRHLIYIDASLAVMAFLFGLEVQGLSSCCINWPDIEAKELAIRDLLKLDIDERPVMLIALGYPDPSGLVAFSEKKNIEQLRRFNFE